MQLEKGLVSDAIMELPQVVDKVENSVSLQSLSGNAKVLASVSMLQTLTSAAQDPFVSMLSKVGLKYEQYWVSNIIKIKGLTAQSLKQLSASPGKFILREEYTVSIDPPATLVPTNITKYPQWGVAKIRAPAAWARTHGEGTVAMIIDSGVNLNHVALRDGYAGAWFDPYYSTANPTDQHGHGSHCACSILGRANGVGVAPAARWIACRGLNHQGYGTESGLISCGQFALTANPRPTVISNSWGGVKEKVGSTQ